MSTYYEYQDVKVMIAHKLMAMDGWKVYGYKADESDGMTDYWSPASWGGVAEKNGYVLCVDVYGASEPQEIRKYNYNSFTYDRNIMDKIEKLSQMTVERGASEQEEESAKMMITRLQEKVQKATEEKYIVTGVIPGHMANPPRMNWHIEKDGIYIAKGNGILKYADISNYYTYSSYIEDMEKFKKLSREEYIKDYVFHDMNRWNNSEERATESANSHYEVLEEDVKLIEKFEQFINKIDTTCGGLLGEGDGVIYEKVTVTEYKKENKAIEDATGSIKEGQCFILKSSFNYGRNKGYTYRIHEMTYDDGQKRYYAYKLNGKKTKECTGQANQANYWWIYDTEKFLKWFEKGDLAWCHIEEVKTPYEVEKVVKKTIKAEKKNTTTTETTEAATEETNVNNYTYEVTEDTDTRDNSKIYLVKVAEKLSREEYLTVNKYMKSLGGYYSKFKHAFLFKENPTDKLNITTMETTQEPTEEKQTETTKETVTEPEKETISYTITEDQHTQTGKTIWIVKPEKELSKTDFAEVKRRLATIQGYYSTFKHGFIFKYNPEKALQTG